MYFQIANCKIQIRSNKKLKKATNSPPLGFKFYIKKFAMVLLIDRPSYIKKNVIEQKFI